MDAIQATGRKQLTARAVQHSQPAQLMLVCLKAAGHE